MSDQMVPSSDEETDDTGAQLAPPTPDTEPTPASAIEQTISQILAQPFVIGREWAGRTWSAMKMLGIWTFWGMIMLLAFCLGVLYGTVQHDEFIKAAFMALPVIGTLVILTRVMWKISTITGIAAVVIATIYGIGLMVNVVTENTVDNPITTTQHLWQIVTGEVDQQIGDRDTRAINELEAALNEANERANSYAYRLQNQAPCPEQPGLQPGIGPVKASLCIDGEPHKWCANFEDWQVGDEPMDLGYVATSGWASDGYAVVTVRSLEDWTEIGRIQQGGRELERHERSRWVQLKRYP